MTQAPCWSRIEVGRILNPDAEAIKDHVFRAVHCATELQIADTADGARVEVSPENFVSRFLDSNKDYVQAVVIGQSGTGKSHLIQWLRLQIPQDDKTVILTIPKSGTSLRGIVERLIACLPTNNQSEYTQKLRQAGTVSTTQHAKVSRFLDALAWSIENGGLATNEIDKSLAGLLPDVFRDPNFRQAFFTREGNSVNAIVEHIFIDPDNRDEGQDRREFQLGDLPLEGQIYQYASRPAQDAIDFIRMDADMEAQAIVFINKNLDAAISQTLNFSADNLIDLMNSLRRYLATEDKRLILLIEDFARLQGIDTALLQALITPPGQGDDHLCELRWAMAVTTGYFQTLAETVRSRATLVVNMDISNPTSLTELTAGYLNALRLGDLKLQSLPPFDEVPSYCASCNIKEGCWAAFGQSDGIGLFPFTESAINVMAIRSESLKEDKQFNPRKFMLQVLKSVLDLHYTDLENGEFPPETLLKRIGGDNALIPLNLQRLQQLDGHNYLRHITLLELWDGTGRLINFHEGVHAAFGIAELDDIDRTGPGPGPEPEPEPFPPPPVGSVIPDVQAVREWQINNAQMSQVLAGNLRELIFEALESFIDWDSLGYKKAAVASAVGTTRIPFRKFSIIFENQQTASQSSLVMIHIEAATNSVLALEALLMHKHHNGWSFPESGDLFANLLEALRSWSMTIEQQLKALYFGEKNWDPLIATVELLTIAIHQSGRIKINDSLEKVVGYIWDDKVPSALMCMDPPFSRFNSNLVAKSTILKELLSNLASGTKGGQAGNFVRIAPVIQAVKSLRQNSLKLKQTPPEECRVTELQALAKLYGEVKNNLSEYLAKEKDLRTEWLLTVQAFIPNDTTIKDLKEVLLQTIEIVAKEGVSVGASRQKLAEILDTIQPTTLDRALTHVRELEGSNTTDSLIRLASVGDSQEKIDALIQVATVFLNNAEASADSRKQEITTKIGAGLEESEQSIESSLAQLAQSLETLYQLAEGPL